MLFPASGVEVNPVVPPLVAFAISFFTSMGGISGAVFLMPFMVSVLGFAAPGASATNLLYNVVASPLGIRRYIGERRMFWPLTWLMLAATLPGMLLGIWLRLAYMPDARRFKIFVGFVLLYLAVNLLRSVIRRGAADGIPKPGSLQVEGGAWNLRRVTCRFGGGTHSVSTPLLAALCFLVGIVGGAYGIGGGAILAPLLVGMLGLPVHLVAGTVLMTNMATSVVGVLVYQSVAPLLGLPRAGPDWMLGFLFGLGGIAGIYLGARCQKHVPARWIEAILTVIVLFVSIRYLAGLLPR